MEIARTFSTRFRPQELEWQHICEPPSPSGYLLDYEYTVLAYDADCGRLDMLMRFQGNGGHCERHRHVASTTTLILDGEQHVRERRWDGTFGEPTIRRAGDYAIAGSDALPHTERGGTEGCTLLLSLHAADGLLFEVYEDDTFTNPRAVYIQQFVKRWDLRHQL